MIKKLVILSVFFQSILLTSVFSQEYSDDVLIGEWNAYLSFSDCIDVVKVKNITYGLSNGGVFTHDQYSGEIKIFAPINGIKSLHPTKIFHDKYRGLIFTGSEEGFVNFFNNPEEISTYTDIERNTTYNNKKIFDFTSDEKYVYIASEFGIIVMDVAKNETKYSFLKIGNNTTGAPVYDIEILNDTIYAATDNGLFFAKLIPQLLSNPDSWQRDSTLSSSICKHILFATNTLFAQVSDSIYKKNGNSWQALDANLQNNGIQFVTGNEFYFGIGFTDTVAVIDQNNIVQKIPMGVTMNNGFIDENKMLIVAKNLEALKFYSFSSSQYNYLIPNSPSTNFNASIAILNDEIYICPNGLNTNGSCQAISFGLNYFSKENTWQNLHPNNYASGFNAVYLNTDNTAYVAVCYAGLFELKNGKLIAQYDHTNTGSNGLKGALSDNDLRINDLDMDENGNLWMTAAFSTNSIIVKTPNNQWFSYPPKLISTKVKKILADKEGNIWVAHYNNGVLIFNPQNTLDNTGDDLYQHINKVIRIDDEKSIQVNDMALDEDGAVWLATNVGISVAYTPSAVYSNGANALTQPIYDKRYLLEYQNCQTIAVDGANRKWIGTNAGLFLFSEDGTSQIFHFTKENSPLTSDNITSIEIDPNTGEVVIGTDEGVFSYKSDAIKGLEDNCELKIFPNPYYTNIAEPVVIKGVTSDAIIKITTISGYLVKEISNLGGQAIWDGTDVRGNKVASGVYFAMVTNKNGEVKCIDKIAVLKK